MSWSIQELRRILLAGDRSCLILLVPFCIFGFLTGCGGGSSDTATVSPTPTPTPTPTPMATTTTWEIVDLGVLHESEEAYSAAYDINDSGIVVGESGSIVGERYGFYWESGSLVPVLDTGADVVEAINNYGVAVGNYYNLGAWGFISQKNGDYELITMPQDWGAGGLHGINDIGDVAGDGWAPSGQRGFILHHDGTFTTIEPLPGDARVNIVAMNDAGTVAGYSTAEPNHDAGRGFVFAGGNLTEIGFLPGASSSYPEDINNQGDIVGSSGGQAFLYRNGSIQQLGFLPGDSYSIAYGINDAGDIVGRSSGSGAAAGAFLLRDGEMVDLSALLGVQESGWLYLSEARETNNVGQIVGQGIWADGSIHAFLLTPSEQ